MNMVKNSLWITIGILGFVLPAMSSDATTALPNGFPLSAAQIDQVTHDTARQRDIPASETLAQLGKLSITEAQQDRLFELVHSQALERRALRRTAIRALMQLQEQAAMDHFELADAQRLTQSYGQALAGLTLLDVQLAAQFRTALTPDQLKILKESINRERLERQSSAYDL